jgi:Carboxypeptidase regulatory-like domain
VTSSAVAGRILSTKQEPLLGAAVVITHEPTGTVFKTITDDNGNYQLENMIVGGPYSLKISYVGYKDNAKTDVFLSLGKTGKVDIALEEATNELATVEVKSSKNDLFDGRKTGAGTNIGRKQLDNLPTLNRSLQDATRLTPQASGNSFAGANFRYNNLSIDGAVANDAFGFVEPSGGASGSVASGVPGNLARSQPISLDAIEEVQVNVAPFDVSQGNFTGGSLNAVTRRGANKTEGSAYFFGRNGSLTRADVTTDGKKQPPQYNDLQTGVRIGGALQKNKVFYFLNLERSTRNEPVGFKPGSSESAIPLDVAKIIADTLQSRYGINTGSYGNIELNSTNTKIFARLDFNLSENHQLTLRHNFVDAQAGHLSRSNAILNYESQGFTHFNQTNVTVAQLKSRFGKNKFNDLLIGYSNIEDYRDPFGDKILPHIEITYNTTNQIFAGTYRESAIYKIKQRALELTDNFTFYKKNHTFLLGTHNELYTIDYHFVTPFNGRWAYASLDNFLADRPSRIRATYSFDNANRDVNINRPSAYFRMLLASVYGQDRIAVTPKLNVSAGFRLDLPIFPDKQAAASEIVNNPIYAGFTNEYGGKLSFSPRVSFNYQPSEKLQIRGGAGLFVGRMPLAWLAYSHIYNGSQFYNVDIRPTGKVPLITDFSKNNTLTTTPQREINLIQNGFQLPAILRGSLGIDYKTTFGSTFSLDILATKTVRDVIFKTINLKDSTIALKGGDGRDIYLGSGDKQKYSAAYTSVFGVANTDKGYRYSISGSWQQKFGQYVNTSLAYTYGKSKDLANGVRVSPQANWEWNQTLDPNNPQLSYSNFDLRHRLVSYVGFQKKIWKIGASSIGIVAVAASGSPFTYTYASDINRDGSSTNDLLFIPKTPDQIALVDIKNAAGVVTTTANEQWQQLNAYIEADDYLKQHRGEHAERNGARTPWNSQIDIHFSQDIRIAKTNFQMTFDIINAGNLVNKNGGQQTFVANTLNSGYQLITVASVTNDQATYRFNNPTTQPYQVDPIASKWQGQLGIRWIF